MHVHKYRQNLYAYNIAENHTRDIHNRELSMNKPMIRSCIYRNVAHTILHTIYPYTQMTHLPTYLRSPFPQTPHMLAFSSIRQHKYRVNHFMRCKMDVFVRWLSLGVIFGWGTHIHTLAETNPVFKYCRYGDCRV